MTMALSLALAFILDLVLGDPPRLPHPVVVIGKGIDALERTLRPVFPGTARGEAAAGALLVVVVVAATAAAAEMLMAVAAWLGPGIGFGVQTFLLYQCLAARCLRDAARAVYRPLAAGDIGAARTAVGHIVGRDTANLDENGVARATVETVAENASDGVIAPLVFFIVGGAPGALAYKAVNTMDSMLGYKNDRYRHFGRVAARLDDVANFVPARLTGLLLIAAALPCGLDWKSAWRVFRRDRRNHTSPNAGHPEAACAGALGVRLGGDSRYGGVLTAKPTIGDDTRGIKADDILRATDLLYIAAGLGVVLGCGVLTGLSAWT